MNEIINDIEQRIEWKSYGECYNEDLQIYFKAKKIQLMERIANADY